MNEGNVGSSGRLDVKLVRADGQEVQHPGLARLFERLMLGIDAGKPLAEDIFSTALVAHHVRDGKTVDHSDTHHVLTGKEAAYHGVPEGAVHLGSGAVTNVGVLALANDFAWAQNAQTIKLANQHACGTGATAAAATDIALQTSAGPAPVAGTQSLVSAANAQAWRTVATLSFTTTLAITEWGLHTDSTLSATTGTPFTAATATGATATGTPYTASSGTVQGQQQHIIKPGTTTVWGLVLTNTTSAFVIPAWYKVADGTAGATPGATEAFSILPVLWDHKVFAAINVVNGDTIATTYTCTNNSGG